MTPGGAQGAVVTAMLGAGIVASVPSLAAGAKWPGIRVVSGIAVTGTFLAFLAPVAPGPVGGLAILILIGSVLTWGPSAITAVNHAQTAAKVTTATGPAPAKPDPTIKTT